MYYHIHISLRRIHDFEADYIDMNHLEEGGFNFSKLNGKTHPLPPPNLSLTTWPITNHYYICDASDAIITSIYFMAKTINHLNTLCIILHLWKRTLSPKPKRWKKKLAINMIK